MKLLFATHNQHKVAEVRHLLENLGLQAPITISTLMDIGYDKEIPETAETFFGNARIKADVLYEEFAIPSFGEDSGLVVPSLGGEPGVYSARYAGENKSDVDNYEKLLEKLNNSEDRRAYFHTSIVFVDDREVYHFEGQVHGEIVRKPQGRGGFGYDPIFKPLGHKITFALMGKEKKSKISHRAIAMKKFISFLEQYVIDQQSG